MVLMVVGLVAILMGTLTVHTRVIHAPAGSEQLSTDTGLEINSITTIGDEVAQGIQLIQTSEEEIIVPPDIAQAGIIWLKNLDITNFVEVGPVTGVYFLQLDPGEVYIFRLSSLNKLFLLADTGDCRVQYKIFET